MSTAGGSRVPHPVTLFAAGGAATPAAVAVAAVTRGRGPLPSPIVHMGAAMLHGAKMSDSEERPRLVCRGSRGPVTRPSGSFLAFDLRWRSSPHRPDGRALVAARPAARTGVQDEARG